jgi:hypothetical protein
MPAATGNTALDVAIGLAFVFLLFSVLCAAAQEFIAGIFDMRAATLERGLRNLLDDSGGTHAGGAPAAVPPAPAPSAAADAVPLAPSAGSGLLSDQVLAHGLIRTLYKDSRVLYRRGRRGPSYIPSRSFALALLNVVAPSTGAEDSMQQLRGTIAGASIPAGTKSALLSLANGAAQDRDELRTLVEEWFAGGPPAPPHDRAVRGLTEGDGRQGLGRRAARAAPGLEQARGRSRPARPARSLRPDGRRLAADVPRAVARRPVLV